MTVAWPVRSLPSRQPHHLPIGLLNEPLYDVAANDPKRTDNYRLILHAVPDQSVTVSESVVVLTATSDSTDRRFELLPYLDRVLLCVDDVIEIGSAA
jgi:hypothetical protein